MLASSLKFPKNSERKRWKLPFLTTPLSFDAPYPGNSSLYLYSSFCVGLRKTYLFCNRLRIGRSSSCKVDFGTNRKGVRMRHPFEFLDELFIAKSRVLGLSLVEDFVILAFVVLTHCQHVTDRQTDNPTVANAGLCIASYMLTPCKN